MTSFEQKGRPSPCRFSERWNGGHTHPSSAIAPGKAERSGPTFFGSRVERERSQVGEGLTWDAAGENHCEKAKRWGSLKNRIKSEKAIFRQLRDPFWLGGHPPVIAPEPPENWVRRGSPGRLEHTGTNGFRLAALKAMLPQSNTL
jgi:hypothetical protein